jgi:hypothetical protein
MEIIDRFYQFGTLGFQVVAYWAPGEKFNTHGVIGWEEVVTLPTWGVYWTDLPRLAPCGYSFSEFYSEKEALDEFEYRRKLYSDVR